MSKPSTLQKFYDCFMDDLSVNTTLTPVEKEQLIRYRHAFHTMLECPWTSTSELRDELMNRYGISESQAYRDIQNLEILKGNVQNTAQSFQLYKINQALDLALKLAIENKDPEAIAKVSAVIGKYNRLDKEQSIRIPTEDIIPPAIEFTSNPEILGIKISDRVKENPRAYIESLINKYTNSINLENSIDYEDIPDEQ